jgi:hypothetical protein
MNKKILLLLGLMAAACGRDNQSNLSAVIGSDDRVTVNDPRLQEAVRPLVSVGKEYCTGFAISERKIVTADHCLRLTMAFGDVELKASKAERFPKADLAILEIVDGAADLTPLPIGGAVSDLPSMLVAYAQSASGLLMADGVKLTVVDGYKSVFLHELDTEPGSSGAPIFQDGRVVAVHLGSAFDGTKNYAVSFMDRETTTDVEAVFPSHEREQAAEIGVAVVIAYLGWRVVDHYVDMGLTELDEYFGIGGPSRSELEAQKRELAAQKKLLEEQKKELERLLEEERRKDNSYHDRTKPHKDLSHLIDWQRGCTGHCREVARSFLEKLVGLQVDLIEMMFRDVLGRTFTEEEARWAGTALVQEGGTKQVFYRQSPDLCGTDPGGTVETRSDGDCREGWHTERYINCRRFGGGDGDQMCDAVCKEKPYPKSCWVDAKQPLPMDEMKKRIQALPAATPPALDTSRPYEVVARHSGKCLDIAHASTAGGATLVQADCWGGANQRFFLRPAGNGFYDIVPQHSGQCLELGHASIDHAAPVTQANCWGGTNQRWKIESRGDGAFRIWAQHSVKCLDIFNGSLESVAPAIQAYCHDGPNQQFYLRKVN